MNKSKKLSLRRESLRQLDESALGAAAGAGTEDNACGTSTDGWCKTTMCADGGVTKFINPNPLDRIVNVNIGQLIRPIRIG